MEHFEITQSEDWTRFQELAGRKGRVLECENGQKAYFIEIPLAFGWCTWRGIGVNLKEWTRKDMHSLTKLARAHKVVSVRFEGHGMVEFSTNKGGKNERSLSADIKNLFQELALKHVPHPYLPEYTIVLDLSLSEEALLTQMKRKGRYNIKLAEKEVRVEKYVGNEIIETKDAVGKSSPMPALDQFYTLARETAKRDGFAVHPKSYYEAMMKGLGKNVILYMGYMREEHGALAKSASAALAGIIIVYGRETAVYYYGASSSTHRDLMAPYILQWEAIKDAKKAGKKEYDFMGTARPIGTSLPMRAPHALPDFTNGHRPDFENGIPAIDIAFDPKDPLRGVSEFKQKFGGRFVTFEPPFDLVLNRGLYVVLSLLRHLRSFAF